MNSFEVYKTYLALRAHFVTDDYDIFKMQGRVRANKNAFSKRKDLYSIEKLSRTYKDDEIVNFLVANFIEGDRWGGVFDNEAQNRYLEWSGRIESLTYNFTNDLDYLQNHSAIWLDLITPTKSTHPYIIKAYLGRNISIETLTILDALSEYSVRNIQTTDTIIWPNLRRIVVKYASFLDYDHERYKQLFGSRFEFRTAENSAAGTTGNSTPGKSQCNAGADDKSNDEHQRNSKVSYKTGPVSTGAKQASKHVALSDYFQ